MDGIELAKRFVELEQERRKLKDEMADVERMRREVKFELLAQFERLGVNSVNVDGMIVHLTHRVAAKVTGDRVRLTTALADYAPELIETGFNLNRLSAMMGEMYREGGFETIQELQNELPEALREHMEVREWFDVLAKQA